jgi:hypothetical protein
MKRTVLAFIILAVLPTFALAQTKKSQTPPPGPGQSEWAPGQRATEPGGAKKYAPGQKATEPGTAKKYAPGQK